MPTPPATQGWHDDPDGRRRWWDGQRWGAYAPWDDHGSPERPSEPQQEEQLKLDGSLTFDPTPSGRAVRAQDSPPEPDAGSLGPRAPQPGGILRWETPPAAMQPAARPAKSMATAYVLLVALGLLGGHRFYLARVPSATVQMMLAFSAAAALVVLQSGDAPIWLLAVPAAAAIWWVADVFSTAGMVNEINRRTGTGGTGRGDTGRGGSGRPGTGSNRSDAPGYERGWPDP